MDKNLSQNSIDPQCLQQALAWEQKMLAIGGLYREHFFEAFDRQLNLLFDKPISVLEVGSGPGHLAKALIESVPITNYCLFDLSDAMNHIALRHLESYQTRINCVAGSFLDAQDFTELELFDAVVCMQSVHEVRDKTLAVSIYNNVINQLKPDGYFLVCDFICAPPNTNDASIYMTQEEQKLALLESGFKSVSLVSAHAGLTLYSAQK
ncbi:MAG: class I SAM-dependent methyltransferase [Algicola sp.]|nr:class I SAM-dependent methyltransferase [Algicola sp.]